MLAALWVQNLEQSTKDALRDVAMAHSPRVEVGEQEHHAWAVLDVSGCEEMFGSVEVMARTLAKAADSVGLVASVGVARTKTLALLLARARAQEQPLPVLLHAQHEKVFLAQLPLALLKPSQALLQRLERFGINSVGEFLALPKKTLVQKLGKEGLQLYQRAQGDVADAALVPLCLPDEFKERAELDWQLDNLEPLLFVLRGLLDRLMARLALRSMLAGDLLVTLHCTSGSYQRRVRVSAPTRDVPSLLMLCRLVLSEQPPEDAVAAVEVLTHAEILRSRQLGLFANNAATPEKLAVTLARLAGLCGPQRVGQPVVLDVYSLDSFEVNPFNIHIRTPLLPENLPEKKQTPCRVLRRLRPPVLVEVAVQLGQPKQILSGPYAGRIAAVLGPYRRWFEDWWGAPWDAQTSHACDLYDATLQSGVVYRLVHMRQNNTWQLLGAYD